jgi:hypothetical protein
VPATAKPKVLLVRVFGIPALLALATLFGLLSALLGQGGVWHVLAWIALCIPLAVLARHLVRCARADAGPPPLQASVAENVNAVERTD